MSKNVDFVKLEHLLLEYLLNNGGRPDEIDISPFLEKYAKKDFQFIYSRLEHNLNTSGFATIRMFQRKGEDQRYYSEFYGSLTENGKIYLEQRKKDKYSLWFKIGSAFIALCSVVISGFSLSSSNKIAEKLNILEKRVDKLEQNQDTLFGSVDTLENRIRNLSDFQVLKQPPPVLKQPIESISKTKDSIH